MINHHTTNLETQMLKGIARVSLLAAMLAAPRIALAQATLAGKWNTDFDTGIRNENGEIRSLGKRAATMTLTVKGDSVLGTWQIAAEGTSASPAPIHLKGTKTGNTVQLRSDPVERTVNMGDGPQQVKMIAIYKFELNGDALTGTAQNSSGDGQFDGPEMPFAAKRAKV